MNEILNQLPKMLTGRELRDALTVLPDYDEAVCQMDSADRLMYLSDIYRIYIPSQMSVEIYSKLYLSMIRSLQKKNTRTAVMQRNENYRRIQSKSYDGIIGGSDSFTIIGCSGIGKSSAIANSIQTATDNVILEIENPYVRIIPCVICQCPHDCSVKGLLLEVLRKIDESIGSNYYKQALRARATTDMLIGNVSQAALNHIGCHPANYLEPFSSVYSDEISGSDNVTVNAKDRYSANEWSHTHGPVYGSAVFYPN